MTESPPLLPAPDELTSFFWEAARRHELMIQRCSACGTYQHPPEPVCHSCLSFDLGGAEVSGRGTVYSYTTATQAFHPPSPTSSRCASPWSNSTTDRG